LQRNKFCRAETHKGGSADLKGFGRLCGKQLVRHNRLSKTVGGSAAVGCFLNAKPTQMANPKKF